MSKEKKEKLLTPVGFIKFPKTKVGNVEYPFLTIPDGMPKEIIASWKFQLVFDPKTPEAKELLDVLDEEHKKIKGANFKPYKKDMEKDDDGNLKESGLVALNLTSSYPPVFIDTKLNKCNVDLGWGSKVRVKFVINPVNSQGKVGLGRYTSVVKVIEPKSGGFDATGFEESEGGFVSEQKAAATADWSE
jgi:hypothetical protein